MKCRLLRRLLQNPLAFALVACGIGLLSVGAEESVPSHDVTGKKMKVFILSGQSGMAGFGRSHELPVALRNGNDRVLMFEGGKWYPLRSFHVYAESLRNKFGLTEFSFCPEIAFAHAMAEA